MSIITRSRSNSLPLPFLREDVTQRFSTLGTKKLVNISIEHFGFPTIIDLRSRQSLTEEEMPAVYQTLDEFCRPKLTTFFSKIMEKMARDSFTSLSTGEIQIKYLTIKQAIDQETYPDWNKLHLQDNDNCRLFEDFKQKYGLNYPHEIHDQVREFMRQYSAELGQIFLSCSN